MQSRAIAFSLAVLAALTAQSTFGHDLSVSHGPFLGAAFHVLTEFDHLAAYVCVGLLCGVVCSNRRPAMLTMVLILLVLSLAAAAMRSVAQAFEPMEVFLSPLSLMLGGSWVALASARLPWVGVTVAAAVTVVHSIANGIAIGHDSSPTLASLGVASAVVLLVAAGASIASLARSPPGRIAVRVLGSWVVALGLLQLGLAVRG